MLPQAFRRPLAQVCVAWPSRVRYASKAAASPRHGGHGAGATKPRARKVGPPRVEPARAPAEAVQGPSPPPSSEEMQWALSRFESEVMGHDAEVDLVRASALLALHAEPDLDPEESVLRPLAALGAEFRAKSQHLLSLAEPMRAHAIAGALCEFLASAEFRGCERTDSGYYRAENSLMHRVLRDRIGIPITLALVYIAVGREAGLELRGVNFPGHFMLAYEQGITRGLLDAFENRLVADEEAAATLTRLFRQEVQLDPNWHVQPLVPPVEMLARMIRNLHAVYCRDGDKVRATWMEQYARVVARLRKREHGSG